MSLEKCCTVRSQSTETFTMAFLAFILLTRMLQPPTLFPLFSFVTTQKNQFQYILHLQPIIIHALNLTQKKSNFLQNKKNQSLQKTPEMK